MEALDILGLIRNKGRNPSKGVLCFSRLLWEEIEWSFEDRLFTEKRMKMNFISPSKGRLSFNQMFRDILAYINEHPDDTYKMIVGTDSQERRDVYYVTAVVILREGKGGRFYYTKERQKGKISMKQRIFLETARSLEVASRLAGKFMAVGKTDFNIEIHLDVGQQGKTKEIIREVVGMVTGSGFDARIKPDSY